LNILIEFNIKFIIYYLLFAATFNALHGLIFLPGPEKANKFRFSLLYSELNLENKLLILELAKLLIKFDDSIIFLLFISERILLNSLLKKAALVIWFLLIDEKFC